MPEIPGIVWLGLGLAACPVLLIAVMLLENWLHHFNRRRMVTAWDAEWEAMQASDAKEGTGK